MARELTSRRELLPALPFRSQLGIRRRGDSPIGSQRADRTGGAVAPISAPVQHRIRVCCVRVRDDDHLRATVGFIALLAPLILLHGFLVRSTRHVHEEEIEPRHQQKEREGLLQKAVEASEAERRRIARDLHDGVVQNLAGMAFALSAEASQLKGAPEAGNGQADLLELLETSADETRGAMKDLRTLIIELAPPTLRREGLQAALLEVLREISARAPTQSSTCRPTFAFARIARR